ncbi:MAG: hypothetical protein OCC46_00860 [Pseudodesulfovibrio sp.]
MKSILGITLALFLLWMACPSSTMAEDTAPKLSPEAVVKLNMMIENWDKKRPIYFEATTQPSKAQTSILQQRFIGLVEYVDLLEKRIEKLEAKVGGTE